MSYQTVVGAFDSRQHAQAAADALKSSGFHPADISILQKETYGNAWTARSPGLWQRLFGSKIYEHEAAVYDQVVERGGAVVSVRVPEAEVAQATGILDLHHPIDLGDRALTSGIAPAA